MKDFFENIRAKDEPTKRKIAVVITIICMIVVIIIWLAYFNPFVAVSVSQEAAVSGQSSAGQ